MGTSRRTVTAALAIVLCLCLGVSGCVTTASDVLQPSAVRGQMPSPPPPPPLPTHRTTYTYLPGDGAPTGPAMIKMPVGPAGFPSKAPAVLNGPRAVPGAPNGAHDNGDPLVDSHPPPGPIPTELNKYAHPPYTIAAPDILIIDAIRLIPKPPYRIEALELLLVNVTVEKREPLPGKPISGQFLVTPEGTINLGFDYGSVRVGGMTLEQAQAAIRTYMGKIVNNPEVTVALVQFRGLQQIRGEHLVRPDGTISLGTYGSVYVAGMTLGQAKTMIEQYLSQYLLNPQISIDVFAYNSKKYYVILDGGGFGQQVIAMPSTGNETVLDAISNVQGLAPVSSKKRIWVARPAPCGHGCAQVLPVDWRAITEGGMTCTNYQLFPGDRVFVSANRLIAFDNYLSMVLAPVERILGITLLGSSTVQSLQGVGRGGGATTGFFIP